MATTTTTSRRANDEDDEDDFSGMPELVASDTEEEEDDDMPGLVSTDTGDNDDMPDLVEGSSSEDDRDEPEPSLYSDGDADSCPDLISDSDDDKEDSDEAFVSQNGFAPDPNIVPLRKRHLFPHPSYHAQVSYDNAKCDFEPTGALPSLQRSNENVQARRRLQEHAQQGALVRDRVSGTKAASQRKKTRKPRRRMHSPSRPAAGSSEADQTQINEMVRAREEERFNRLLAQDWKEDIYPVGRCNCEPSICMKRSNQRIILGSEESYWTFTCDADPTCIAMYHNGCHRHLLNDLKPGDPCVTPDCWGKINWIAKYSIEEQRFVYQNPRGGPVTSSGVSSGGQVGPKSDSVIRMASSLGNGTGQGNELDKQTRDQGSSRRGSGTDKPPVPDSEATQDRSKPVPVPSVPDEDMKAPPTKERPSKRERAANYRPKKVVEPTPDIHPVAFERVLEDDSRFTVLRHCDAEDEDVPPPSDRARRHRRPKAQQNRRPAIPLEDFVSLDLAAPSRRPDKAAIISRVAGFSIVEGDVSECIAVCVVRARRWSCIDERVAGDEPDGRSTSSREEERHASNGCRRSLHHAYVGRLAAGESRCLHLCKVPRWECCHVGVRLTQTEMEAPLRDPLCRSNSFGFERRPS
ncbi:hypothetical protein PBRA_001927 [Plasmodiophora brassicae]|uniref:Uncharacterized protein n=1 Tax=Plasmodiophora brassicae TaxID=37360 RepID=A0A0G4J202_PLABS|nr:hypothetical protein PBRA_001927 [Plasmodiophora brassicae]